MQAKSGLSRSECCTVWALLLQAIVFGLTKSSFETKLVLKSKSNCRNNSYKPAAINVIGEVAREDELLKRMKVTPPST
ncbi:3537_t:CDS:2 [Funneliformis mosseae]|uniref:3537_t:CDS:1 n=1 Tax=Funneliformis mosseae TaxID=27381 RepID=A0A9N8WPN3_FUNMO|nr:3537_t:CDS:2 [Funneliformis mosseae]